MKGGGATRTIALHGRRSRSSERRKRLLQTAPTFLSQLLQQRQQCQLLRQKLQRQLLRRKLQLLQLAKQP